MHYYEPLLEKIAGAAGVRTAITNALNSLKAKARAPYDNIATKYPKATPIALGTAGLATGAYLGDKTYRAMKEMHTNAANLNKKLEEILPEHREV